MKYNTIHSLDKLDALLAVKDFEQLSAEEREFVSEQLTDEEYGEMHTFYNNLEQNRVAEIEPSASLKSKLNDFFQPERGKKINSFWNRKMSVIQVAAVAVICFIIGFGIKSIDSNPAKSDTIVDSIIYDTVQVVKYIQMPLNNHFAYYQSGPWKSLSKENFPDLNSNFYHQKDAVMYADNNLSQTKVRANLSDFNKSHAK